MSRDVRIEVGLPGQLEARDIQLPDGEPDPWGPGDRLTVVGTRVPRLDGVPKVTGAATYTADVALPGMLHGAILRSPHPKARAVAIDAREVRAHPGVRAVLAFEGTVARFEGEEVAAVAAVSAAVAEEALRLFRVTWEVLPSVVETDAALRPGAPRVFEDRGNAGSAVVKSKGDAKAALAGAPHVVEGTYRTRVQTHVCLEPHGLVAAWSGDRLTVWCSTQGTFSVREGLAEALDMPPERIEVVCEYMGGGFGSKFGPGSHGVIAARLAREAGAPVRLVLSRHDEHVAGGCRSDAVMHLRAGADAEGKLLALHLVAHGTPGVGSGAGVSGFVRNAYDVPHYLTEERDVLTNTGAAQPMRAPGHPQGAFAMEQTIDELAARVGMDPLAYRKHVDRHPVRLQQYDAGAAAIGWDRRAAIEAENARGGPRRRGIGMASSVWYNTGGPGATVEVVARRDGVVEVRNGAQDIGTGTRTFVAMVAAEELRLPLHRVLVKLGRTEWPEGPGSGGSTTAATLSPAVRGAAHALFRKLARLAARTLGCRPEAVRLEAAPGAPPRIAGEGGRAISWDELAASLPAEGLAARASRRSDHAGKFDRIAGVQFAEVEVDVPLGRIRVLRVVAVHDCGRVLNPLLVESQINGGVIQGVSFALHEERVLDPRSGRMLNANVEQYKIAGSLDVPEIQVITSHVEAGFTSTGALGIGESPVIPTAAAIGNAFAHATGVRMRELPMTPARVLAALRAAREAGRRA